MKTASVKNWKQFQHYRDRSPPWIKLHRSLLDDFNYTSLPLASKALAPLVWLLAAESQDGTVPVDPEWLAFRLRWKIQDVQTGLKPLLDKGFLIVASDVLADCEQPATPEREAEGETKQKALDRPVDRFDDFWTVYPEKVGKKPCRDKWKAKRLDAKADEIIEDVKMRKAKDRRWLDGYVPNPLTYLNQERWDDELQQRAGTGPAQAPRGKPSGPSETPLEHAIAYARQQHSLGLRTDEELEQDLAEARRKHGAGRQPPRNEAG